MTHLSLLRRWWNRYNLIGFENIDGCNISIWTDFNEGYVLTSLKPLLDDLIRIVVESGNYGKKFKELDIIFHCNLMKPIARVSEEAKAMSSGLETVPEKIELGWVEIEDFEAERNIINLELAEIEASFIHQTLTLANRKLSTDEEIELFKDERKALASAQIHFKRTLLSSLGHELTHLWQIKQSEAMNVLHKNHRRLGKTLGFGEYNEKKFNNIYTNVLETIKDLDLNKNKDLKKIHGLLKTFYVIVRRAIEQFKYYLVTEGMANFLGLYSSGNYDYRAVLAKAEKYTNILSSDFQYLLANLESFFKELKFLDPVEVEAAKKNGDMSFVFETLKRTVEGKPNTYLKFFENVHLIIFKRLKAFSYVIGPVIPATLFEFGGYSIKEIGRMRPAKMIRLYENVCMANRMVPMVALRPKTGAWFNLGKATINLNLLRKKFGIR